MRSRDPGSWFATPTARLGRRPNHSEGDAERWNNPERSRELSDQLAALGISGQLNPTWVEWLMGFPTGWTDCAASATPSSPKSPNGSADASWTWPMSEPWVAARLPTTVELEMLRDAGQLICTCPRPDPHLLPWFVGAVECGRCGRKVLP